MTAAAIVPTVVQKTYIPSIGKTGTPMRLVKYTFKVTKVTDADWIVAGTYFQAGSPILYNAVTVDSSGDCVQEGTVGLTFTLSGTLLTLSGGTTGTTYGEIVYEE